MNIEVISIGDELLKGTIVNTNAPFICRHLLEKGYRVSRQTTLCDERIALAAGLKEALHRSDLVITTGGLGPTLDDQTREAAAELFGSDFHIDEHLAEELKRRYAERYAAVQDQARVPRKAQLVRNRVGSAPGLLFSEKGKTLILMPGVPKEMEAMFIEEVLPLIEKQAPRSQRAAVVQLHFALVYESLLDPHLREFSKRYPAVETGVYPAEGRVTVLLLSADPHQLSSYQKELAARFDSYHYSSSSGKIEEALQAWFVKHKKTLFCAESCTGGAIASCLTRIPGASDYFLGSCVAYANGCKEKLLGVSARTLHDHGAVSAEVVREMLAGVFRTTSADYAIAVSGIAGPAGGTPDKPVGTIWAAIGERGKEPDVGTFKTYGSREKIILTTAYTLLGVLQRKVEKEIPAFPLFLESL